MPCEDNPIGALQELSQAQGGRPTPYYELQAVSGESHSPHFTYEARWAELKAVGEGSSKKEAKKCAAKNLLKLVRSERGDGPASTNQEEEEEEEKKSETDTDSSQSGGYTVKYYRGNQVGQLQEYLMSRALGPPSYQEGETTGPPHKQHFTITVAVGDLVGTGHGKTKKEAKASGAILEQIIQQSNCSTEASKDETGCEEEVADMNAKVEELTL